MKPITFNAVFHVTDLKKSIEFYTSKLGFEVDFVIGDPQVYAGLSLGPVSLHLSSSYPYKNNTGHGDIYLTYESVDDLYRVFVEKNVEFYSHIGDREYGMRDFAIIDPDENQLGFGASLT